LTNNDDAANAPVLGEYTLCGQYPGAVPAGATVTVYCTDVYQRRLRFRYVIVQFPLVDESMNVCEVEVFAVVGLSPVTTVCVRQKLLLFSVTSVGPLMIIIVIYKFSFSSETTSNWPTLNVSK